MREREKKTKSELVFMGRLSEWNWKRRVEIRAKRSVELIMQAVLSAFQSAAICVMLLRTESNTTDTMTIQMSL